MRVLAIEPYYGGSHRAFVDGWMAHSRHDFDILTCEPHHWKWRMRHSAVTAAQEVHALCRRHHAGLGETGTPEHAPWDALWCSSMLDLATFLGLTRHLFHSVPTILYFHENQLAYPSAHPDARDVHFAFTHWTGALAADELWFNSAYNRNTLVDGLSSLFRKMPDNRALFDAASLVTKSRILPPGLSATADVRATPAAQATSDVSQSGFKSADNGGALNIAWAARWEHDKGPEILLEALQLLTAEGVPFRLCVLGEQFKTAPPALSQIKDEFGASLECFGFAPRSEYERHLRSSDVFVSTSHHEFFGLSVMEAALAGCRLLLPRRLVYPELFDDPDAFYDGTALDLARKLRTLSDGPKTRGQFVHIAETHLWAVRAAELDAQLQRIVLGLRGARS